MIKEKIKEKAKEQFPNDEFKQQIVIDAINWATKEFEKENAELQHKVDILQGFLDQDVELDNLQKEITELKKTYRKQRNKRIDELQKENTELKKKLKALEGQTPWKDIKDKSEVIGKLTKAKELLKRWVNSYGYIDVALCKQTEQFISKV